MKSFRQCFVSDRQRLYGSSPTSNLKPLVENDCQIKRLKRGINNQKETNVFDVYVIIRVKKAVRDLHGFYTQVIPEGNNCAKRVK